MRYCNWPFSVLWAVFLACSPCCPSIALGCSLTSYLVDCFPPTQSLLRQNQSEYRDQMLAKLSGSSIAMRVRRFLLRASWTTVDHSYVLLLLGVAGYKFVEWMYSEEGVAVKLHMTGADSPIPPPPLPPQFSGNALTLASTDPSMCPVCGKARVNPAMAVSGYVFCYTCIYRYVEQHGECPVTQMKCDLPSIAKIYDDARDV